LLQNGHAVEDNSGTRFGPALAKRVRSRIVQP
jgi:hypothetical protein